MALISKFFHGFIIAACFIQFGYCHVSYERSVRRALFVFGDSLFDPGNNNYINTTTQFQANWWPYGESFFKPPTGRFCDGRIIPDFIAEYAELPLIPSYFEIGKDGFIHGVNFASGGAGCLEETFRGFGFERDVGGGGHVWPLLNSGEKGDGETGKEENMNKKEIEERVIDLKTQLKYFKKVAKDLKKKFGAKKSKQLLSNAVYIFSAGNNDYFEFPTAYSKEEYVKMVVGNLTSVLKGIYKKGGRKFAILSLAPLGCTPGSRALNFQQGNKSGNCLEELTNLAKIHNSALPKMLKQLEEKLPGFKYSLFDFFKVAIERIDNPSKYGFKTSKSACCGTGPFRGIYSCGGKRQVKEYKLCKNVKDYIFFDSGHLTEVAYKQVAELLWNGTKDVVNPYNLKSFFDLPA
ncbi:PREDICTED: GDSL esterase/lipase 1-like isoform X1 [Nicotiana attenuata]|uniref:GDSL esterase/lipase 1-like isoform X1 n=1 Tax=Nicotiana attenuata TaxID=49451 RepID=UPI0009050D78|nr:PREDICTED: GDSL esterase/lipase 1-like isoform X1 [Nicotiana attenuata]